MLLWFAGLSMLIVWTVFRSPVVDYRLVALGAVLPVLEVAVGRPAVLHTLAAPVGLMGLVMAGYRGKRLAQRRMLGVPIGLFLHLVLDGVWSNATLFWWPVTGLDFAARPLPELSRGWLSVAFELLGALTLVWWWRRWRLAEPARRDEFFRTGRLDRDLVEAG